MTNSNNYSDLLPHLADAFQRYYNLGHAVVSVEMMKCAKDTGDMSMETVNIVLLDPTSYQCLRAMIPLLHEPSMQRNLLAVIDEVIARSEKDQDSDPESA